MQDLNNIFLSQRLLNAVNNDIHRLKEVHNIWLQLIKGQLNFSDNTAVSPNILENCLPVSIRKKTLYISCESSLIANHLRFIQQPLLLTLLNNGIEDISQLHVSIAQAETKDNPAEKNHAAIRSIDPKTIETLEQFTRSCTSEKLRLSTERLLKQFQNAKK